MPTNLSVRQFLGRFRVDRHSIGSDLAAGATLGLESIPSALASGVLAGVNPLYGIYAVMLSTPVGALFTSSEFMSVQPTSAMALIVAGVALVHTGENPIQSLFALSLLTGLIMLAFGVLRLGEMLRFIPKAVMTGFINGVAVLIILGQLGDFTGYSSTYANKVGVAIDTVINHNKVDLETLAVGATTILLILILSRTRLSKFSMVIALILASLLIPLFNWEGVSLVKNVSEVPDTLPHPAIPDLRLLPSLLVPALSLAIVGMVQGAGISQGYANPDGKHPNASRDFVGEGLANIASSLFQGMPVGGSLSATSLVVIGGARSRWANIITGLVIAITLLLFGGVVGQLAMSALAGLLIVVGFQMLRPQAVETVWKTGSVQQVVMGTTFVATLLIPLQYAVLVGVAISLLLYAFDESNRIRIVEWKWREGEFPLEKPSPEQVSPGVVTILIPYGSLFFAAAPIFEKQLPGLNQANLSVVVLGLKGYIEVGSTFLEVLSNYSRELRSHNSRLILAEVSRSIMEQLERTGKIKSIGRRSVFLATERFGESIIQAQDAGEDWINHIEEPNIDTP